MDIHLLIYIYLPFTNWPLVSIEKTITNLSLSYSASSQFDDMTSRIIFWMISTEVMFRPAVQLAISFHEITIVYSYPIWNFASQIILWDAIRFYLHHNNLRNKSRNVWYMKLPRRKLKLEPKLVVSAYCSLFCMPADAYTIGSRSLEKTCTQPSRSGFPNCETHGSYISSHE